MADEFIDTLIVGGGQAGLAISAHLRDQNVPHLILERSRIGEAWRTARWDSLVANGPAWHDRFPAKEFADVDGDAFAPKDSVVRYLEEFAGQIDAPIRCGVEATKIETKPTDDGYRIETDPGVIEARNVVVATGPFQKPIIPPLVPETQSLTQLHSHGYKNPDQLEQGAVLVVGAGSSGGQIADELLRAGRNVFLSVGPHDRPPRSYRGKDFVWWLGVLGKWQAKTPPVGREHVTISVSGAHGGKTVDFRHFAERGMVLVGMAAGFQNGVMQFAADLSDNIAQGDANYLSVLEEADTYINQQGLDFPLEPEAKELGPEPECARNPITQLDLEAKGIKTIIWATGYAQDFKWLQVDAFDAQNLPVHDRGVSKQPGIYFLGLPWLSMRGSSFIWGVWEDAKYLANHISLRRE
ncbi:MAG: NAD(P)/FAD-dependent oxidoreductase [Rhizobiaceae bacterium]